MTRFSLILMEHFAAPRNFGKLDPADAVGRASLGGESPRVTFYLKIVGEVVERATYETAGCGVAIAACSLLSIIVANRRISDCLAVTADALDRALGGIPPEKKYCANLAIEALRDAIGAATVNAQSTSHPTENSP